MDTDRQTTDRQTDSIWTSRAGEWLIIKLIVIKLIVIKLIEEKEGCLHTSLPTDSYKSSCLRLLRSLSSLRSLRQKGYNSEVSSDIWGWALSRYVDFCCCKLFLWLVLFSAILG